jgi:leucyl aminopeptidase
MKSFLTEFSSFRTRYYKSDTGKQSQAWLLSQIKEIIKPHKGVSVKEFPHAWGQNSIIVRFEPAKQEMKDAPVVVLGAHQDSANSWIFFPAP